MRTEGKDNRLNYVMEMLGIRANALAQESGADHSLITKWRRGERKLTRSSKNLLEISEALLRIDTSGNLVALIEPYKNENESPAETLCGYLVGYDLPALPPRTAPPERKSSGEYTVQHRVYLGQKGFRNALVAMLDYLMAIPAGREIVTVCNGNYNWVMKNPSYISALIERFTKAFNRQTTITVVNRQGQALIDLPAFASAWMAAHLKGFVRSRYYDGEMAKGDRMVASIQDYWSLHTRDDESVEDGLFTAMYTDPLDFGQDARICDEYYRRSRPLSQYDFLKTPQNPRQVEQLWDGNHSLMASSPRVRPDGSFYSIQRVPVFGVMTRNELAHLFPENIKKIPDFMFAPEAEFAPGSYKMILCTEDVRSIFLKPRIQHGALRDLMGQPATLPRETGKMLIQRVLKAMEKHPDFEVALVPRCAFKKLQLEMVCWQNSATVAWLQDHSQSSFTIDEATSNALHGSIEYTWDRLLAGWKRQDRIRRQLRKWLADKDLDTTFEDSAIVRGWNPLYKGQKYA